MKNIFKKTAALCAAALLALSMAGCSKESADTTDPEALLKKAQETMADVTSMSADMVMTQEMAYGEESYTATVSMHTLTTQDPTAMQIEMVTEDGTTPISSTIYVKEEGDQYIMYANVDGTWFAQSIDAADLEQYETQDNMNLYLSNISSFTIEGTETINETETTIISGVITGDAMQEAVSSLGMEEILGETDLAELYEDLGDLPIRMWIDADGYVLKYEMDLTEMMQKMMDKMVEMLGGTAEDSGISVVNVTAVMTCGDFNEITSIEIPAEALEATVISG